MSGMDTASGRLSTTKSLDAAYVSPVTAAECVLTVA